MDGIFWLGVSCATYHILQGLPMSSKQDLEVLLFFSNTNHASLGTRKALGEYVEKSTPKFTLKARAVDYDNQKEICIKYGVYGVPVTLILRNDEIIGRHYGERTSEEFEEMLEKHMVHK